MAYVSLIQPEEASPEVQEIYEQKLKGKPNNVQKALAHRPDMLKNFIPFYASVGRSLERKLYELIYIRVSIMNECHYCLQHHLSSSKRAGVTPEQWTELKAGNFSTFTEKERWALIHAEKLTHAPGAVVDDDFLELRKHFSDAEIVDIHMLTGLANLTNRFTSPLGLEVEFPEETIP